MRDALNKLIEAVEAGKWDGSWNNLREISPDLYPPKFSAAFHGSLDAAKALHEALLPGWEWGRAAPPGSSFFVKHSAAGFVWASSKDPARAWLLAILRAYAAQQEPTP